MNDMEFLHQAHAERKVYDKDGDQEIFEYVFKPAFKDSANLSRSVYYTSYLKWTGKVRELALAEIGSNLVEDLASGSWGMVTNWADLRIVGDVFSFEKVLARFRIGCVIDAIIPLTCEFYKVNSDFSLVPLGVVEQETTWVEVIGHGRVTPAPFPDYLQAYLNRTKQKKTITSSVFSEACDLFEINCTEELYQAPLVPGGLPVVASENFSTSLEDANLVGNVYYANYFIWQGRVRDQLNYSIIAEHMRGVSEQGEMICSHARMDYLRDAMPFDNVHVTLSIQSLYKNRIDFRFQFFRSLENGKMEKLAVGSQSAYWIEKVSDTERCATELPAQLQSRLLEMVNEVERKTA